MREANIGVTGAGGASGFDRALGERLHAWIADWWERFQPASIELRQQRTWRARERGNRCRGRAGSKKITT
jgi:hypothetical protein